MDSRSVLISYLKWLQSFNPVLYAALKVSRPDLINAIKANGLAYLSADEPAVGSEPWYKSILDTVAQTVKAFVPIYQQKKILDTQIDLMKKGMPPLTNDQIMAAGTTSIQVELPPDIKDQVIKTAQTAQSGINWGMVGILGAVGFTVWKLSQPKSRRR